MTMATIQPGALARVTETHEVREVGGDNMYTVHAGEVLPVDHYQPDFASYAVVMTDTGRVVWIDTDDVEPA